MMTDEFPIPFHTELSSRATASNEVVEAAAHERFESEDTVAGASASASAAQWAQSWQWFQERRRLVSRALNAYLTCIAIPLPIILNGTKMLQEKCESLTELNFALIHSRFGSLEKSTVF